MKSILFKIIIFNFAFRVYFRGSIPIPKNLGDAKDTESFFENLKHAIRSAFFFVDGESRWAREIKIWKHTKEQGIIKRDIPAVCMRVPKDVYYVLLYFDSFWCSVWTILHNVGKLIAYLYIILRITAPNMAKPFHDSNARVLKVRNPANQTSVQEIDTSPSKTNITKIHHVLLIVSLLLVRNYRAQTMFPFLSVCVYVCTASS